MATTTSSPTITQPTAVTTAIQSTQTTTKTDLLTTIAHNVYTTVSNIATTAITNVTTAGADIAVKTSVINSDNNGFTTSVINSGNNGFTTSVINSGNNGFTTADSQIVPGDKVTADGAMSSTTTVSNNGGGLAMETIYISAGAAGGTVFLVILIVICCICCRCGRKSKAKKQESQQTQPHHTGSLMPPGIRPEPIGYSDSMLKTQKDDSTYQRRDPAVYRVEDPPPNGYQYQPYVVGDQQTRSTGRQDPSGIYSVTGNEGPAPPPFNSLSIPRPTLKPQTPDTNYQSSNKGKYTAAKLYGTKERDEPLYETRIPTDYPGNSRIQASEPYRNQPESPMHENPQQYDQRYPSTSPDVILQVHPDYGQPPLHTNNNQNYNQESQPYKISANDNRGNDEDMYSQNKAQIQKRYLQRHEQTSQNKTSANSSALPADRARSGKYETEITPYMGSTYALSGDFTQSVEPVHTPPVKLPHNAHQVLPKSPQSVTHPQLFNETPTTKPKPARKVPPEKDDIKETGNKNELSSNPVFNKRKDLIAKECKTIRIKDDGSSPSEAQNNSPFIKADPAKTDEEDPYWKIRESRLHIPINIIPQSNDSPTNNAASHSSGYYDDTIPNHRQNMPYANSNDDDYEDTIAIPKPEAIYVNQDNENIYDDSVLPPPMVRAGAESEDGLTDTARRRLPSMRASMPPDALNNAIDDWFEDAIAGSEIDLSTPQPPSKPSVNNNQKAPVLKRKTKMEESKSDELNPSERESWRVSRSSFFDEIGVYHEPSELITADKADINAAMVKKGMAMRDANKPFNYMSTK